MPTWAHCYAGVRKEADHEASQDEGEDDDNDWLENTTKYLFNNFKVDFSVTNMQRIEEKIMEKNKSGDWSKVYQVRQYIVKLNFNYNYNLTWVEFSINLAFDQPPRPGVEHFLLLKL